MTKTIIQSKDTSTTDKKVIQNPDLSILKKKNVPPRQIQRQRKNSKIIFFYRLYFNFVMRISLFAFERILKGKVSGLNNIQNTPACVLVINHVSYFDWMVVYSYFRLKHGISITFLAKEKLFNHIIWRPLMICANCIKVPEKNNFSEYKIFLKRIRTENHIIGVFPEGTRSVDGKISKVKDGATDIAIKKRWPIIPVGLVGFYEFWPKGKLMPKLFFNKNFIPVKISIGKPIFLNPDISIFIRKDMTKIIMSKVAGLCKQELSS